MWDPPSTSGMEFEIYLLGKSYEKQIVLEPHVNKALEYYFKKYHKKSTLDFDCYAFVNRIERIESHKVRNLYAYWVTRPLKRPRRNDIILLLNLEKKMFRHAAIYLGHGIYLSVYGGGGDIELATLQDLKQTFGPSEVFVGKPIAHRT